MKELDTLKWDTSWVSHLGGIKGCLDYLGLDISKAWLYGGTGHAFVINMHEACCPSSPTAWRYVMLFDLADNLGYQVAGVHAHKSQPGFREAQRQAWEHICDALDRGLPCYGWELEVPEFYVIHGYVAHGYDDGGYLYRDLTTNERRGPKAWETLGDTGIGVLEAYHVAPGQAADDRVAVREALQAALHHAENPSDVILDGYRAGLEGYDNWIQAVEQGPCDRMGMAYNAGVWQECREQGVGFLQEAKARLPGVCDAAFDRAVDHYAAVSEALKEVMVLYPFADNRTEDLLPQDARSQRAVVALRRAKEAESQGLDALREIVAALSEGEADDG